MEARNNDKLIAKCDNTKDALRNIAKRINSQFDENWNTRTFGSKIITLLGGKEDGFAIKDEYIVLKHKSGRISVFKVNPNCNNYHPFISSLSYKRLKIIEVMLCIDQKLTQEEKLIESNKVKDDISSYSADRWVIHNIFKNSKTPKSLETPKSSKTPLNYHDILLQLRVIDAMYSTNMSRRYYGIEELASTILKFKSYEELAKELHLYLETISKNDPNAVKEKRIEDMFNKPYGIHKNCSSAGVATSLVSKYSYFALMMCADKYPNGFPIYDSLAKTMLPIVCKYLGVRCAWKGNGQNLDIDTFLKQVTALKDCLCISSNIFNRQLYDILDAYLWTMGKINGGNFSLIMSRKDYEIFIKNLGLDVYNQQNDNDDTEKFNKAVLDGCKVKISKGESLFKGCDEEDFFDTLLEHLEEITPAKQ